MTAKKDKFNAESLKKAQELGQQLLTELDQRGADMEKVRALIEAGADMESKNSTGNTPLIRAAIWGHIDVVKMLLDRGANINAQNEMGTTPLMAAAGWDYREIVMLLLDRGANIFLKDKEGGTVLTRARTGQQREIAEMLEDKLKQHHAYLEWVRNNCPLEHDIRTLKPVKIKKKAL